MIEPAGTTASTTARTTTGTPGGTASSATARTTRQRSVVAAALEEVEGFLSAQDLHELLRRRGETVGLATVYRALAALAEAGELDVLRGEDGEAAYRRCSRGHHHHLVCRSCGRAVEVGGSAVERWTAGVAAEHGFTDVAHTLELFGVCPHCTAGAGPDSTPDSERDTP